MLNLHAACLSKYLEAVAKLRMPVRRASATEVLAGPNNADLTGGWLNGGPAGNLKMTMPTAFTVSVLSWSMLAFPDGYARANATSDTMSTIK